MKYNNQGHSDKQRRESYTFMGIALIGMIVLIAGTVLYESYSDVIKYILFKT
jgi:hypothetical protein